MGRSTLGLTLSGRRVAGGDLTTRGIGAWSGQAGVTEVVLSNEGRTPVAVGTLTQVRDTGADRNSARVEAEAGRLAGGAAVTPGTWASGGSYGGWLGNNGTLTVDRPAAVRKPGQYDLTVGYAQAERTPGTRTTQTPSPARSWRRSKAAG
jgi:hypothetical protein